MARGTWEVHVRGHSRGGEIYRQLKRLRLGLRTAVPRAGHASVVPTWLVTIHVDTSEVSFKVLELHPKEAIVLLFPTKHIL